MISIQYAIFLVPAIMGLTYMVLHEDLSMTGLILFACVAFTAVMLFIVYKISEADMREKMQTGGKTVDKSAYKIYKAESLSETCHRLSAGSGVPGRLMSVCQYLRETVRTDTVAAVEVVDFNALSSCTQLLLSGDTDPQSALAALELVCEVLSNKQAKAKLASSIEKLHALADESLHWTVVLLSKLLRTLALSPDVMPLSGVLLSGGADINIAVTSSPVAFAAGEGESSKAEHLIGLAGKALVLLGLLCDDCPDAQTRINDRGGVKVLLGTLAMAVLMCSTSTGSAGIGTAATAAAAGAALMSAEKRRKHSALLCKWACWCLFNLTLDHPPAKAVLYHCNGIPAIVDALKLHTDSVHVHRQGLAVLFNTISPDQYTKYSLAHARQSLLANGIVDVVEHAKVAFKQERDIIATCRAISNSMMVDFS